ncbi:hypothetical protein F5Y19DRAFT_124341 [Xylariaceae sp. FL1651]|nr:hypothetical protein F5Y19DRAFT_124341 [Xylariaceae sp. FL1651]
MDPLSILSVAAAAIQFLDFGIRVLGDAHELYNSTYGQKEEHIELSKISQDLTTFANIIETKLIGVRHVSISNDATDDPARVLLRLCGEAKDIDRELKQLLAKLQVNGVFKVRLAANSFRAALKGILSESKVELLQKRLNDTKSQIMLALLSILSVQAENSNTTMTKVADQQMLQMEKLQSIDDSTRELGKILQVIVQGTTSTSRLQAQDSGSKPLKSMDTIALEPQTCFNMNHFEDIAGDFLSSIRFESIESREKAIPEAYVDTYKWIFDKPRCTDDGKPLWSDFTSWLSGSSSQIFWIFGKPGAGKSTLMKFFTKDPRLESSLREWTGPLDIVIATYYSWNPGDNMQNSEAGLLRTLLHQCLSQRPELLPRVFPGRWAMTLLGRVHSQNWTCEELREGFQNLLRQAGTILTGTSSFKLGFFIDGLDEFTQDHKSLTEFLIEASSYPSVKVCASSRPWNVFRDAFDDSPTLQLEKLTRDDIRLYIMGRFQTSRSFEERKVLQPTEVLELLNSILDKAQGVFVWVSVVVRELLQNLQDGATLRDLQATVNDLSHDISQLFDFIWNRISLSHQHGAVRYFSIMETFIRYDIRKSSVALWLGEEEPILSLVESAEQLSILLSAASSARRSIDARTRGILETYDWRHSLGDIPYGGVDYMHRTARDWVRKNLDNFKALLEPDFECEMAALSCIVQMTAIDSLYLREICDGWGSELFRILTMAVAAGENYSSRAILIQTLDRLDGQLSSMHGSSNGHYAFPIGLNQYTQYTLIHHILERRKFGKEIGFLGLMAEFSISAYIKAKVLQQPSIVLTKGNLVPLLISLIYSGLLLYNPHIDRRSHPRRLDLTKFLLPYLPITEIQRARTFVSRCLESGGIAYSQDDIRFLDKLEKILTADLRKKRLLFAGANLKRLWKRLHS